MRSEAWWREEGAGRHRHEVHQATSSDVMSAQPYLLWVCAGTGCYPEAEGGPRGSEEDIGGDSGNIR